MIHFRAQFELQNHFRAGNKNPKIIDFELFFEPKMKFDPENKIENSILGRKRNFKNLPKSTKIEPKRAEIGLKWPIFGQNKPNLGLFRPISAHFFRNRRNRPEPRRSRAPRSQARLVLGFASPAGEHNAPLIRARTSLS